MDAILGLDVGTTTTKAVLFDLTGVELGRSASAPYRNRSPQPGWMEQDPEEVWQAVLAAVRQLMAAAHSNITVRALSLAAQSGSLLPVTAHGEPVYPLITWMDGRSKQLVQEWRQQGVQERVKFSSGWSLYPGLCLPTIAWLRRHDSDTFAAAHRYFSVNDFIAGRLTNHFVTNPSNGGGMQLVDIRDGRWSDDLCCLAGISQEQLSPIQPSGAVIGEIRPDVCHHTGLAVGTVLVNGGHDQGCTALALGVNTPGKLLLAGGTAWVITGVTASPDLQRIPPALDWNFHVLNDRYTISQSLGGLGATLEWWLNQAWHGVTGQTERREMFTALNKEMTSTKLDSALYFLPLTGGHTGPATTRRGGFLGLHLGHTRADMARAVMESAAFELRWALEPIEQAGLPVKSLWLVGGAAQSAHWPQILADVIGIPIRLPQNKIWPAVGAAILAGVGSGLFENINEALAQFKYEAQDIFPEATRQARYGEIFAQYQEYSSLF